MCDTDSAHVVLGTLLELRVLKEFFMDMLNNLSINYSCNLFVLDGKRKKKHTEPLWVPL